MRTVCLDLAPFVDNLEPVNAVADAAPGFVRRLQEEAGNATGLRPWGRTIIVNLSVWTDITSLASYVYGAAHAAVLKQRRMFFSPMPRDSVALWCVPEGHEPGLVEAQERLHHLRREGPTAYTFTLRHAFDPDGEAD